MPSGVSRLSSPSDRRTLWWEWPARSLVAISKARDVKALLMEISILPIQAPSIRTCTSRFPPDRKSTRLNSSHLGISYAVFCLKKYIASTIWRLVLLHWRFEDDRTHWYAGA